MKYFSLNHTAPKASFKEAVIRGLAPDKGLYFPEEIPALAPDFIRNIESYTPQEIAFKVIEPFVGDDIPEPVLKKIIKETLSFDFPLVQVEDHIHALELFHGPTMAFKDVGARFMARCLGYFNSIEKHSDPITVLVATSGDTGSAVASGFFAIKGIKVVILYPYGKVSAIQEKQLTTFGRNITALEVKGVFDNCQQMVKMAFLDPELANKRLTSANSINVARWLPQMFYFFFAYKALKNTGKALVFSTPSGNFGNNCAGIMASKLGLPIKHFIAATNSNDTVPRYLKTGDYLPNPTVQTISNAADVSQPSNFIRIQQLYNNDFKTLKKHLSAYSFTDEATKKAMISLYNTSGYVAEPHGALGYLGAKEYLKRKNATCVFLETAHPVKFLNVVEETLNIEVAIPKQIQKIMDKKQQSVTINNYKEFRDFLKHG